MLTASKPSHHRVFRIGAWHESAAHGIYAGDFVELARIDNTLGLFSESDLDRIILPLLDAMRIEQNGVPLGVHVHSDDVVHD